MQISSLPYQELPKVLAYLDPGSGSMIIQMIIAAILGGGLLLRTFWNRITGKGNAQEDPGEETTGEQCESAGKSDE